MNMVDGSEWIGADVYDFFSDPVKSNYELYKDKVPILQQKLNGLDVSLFLDEDGKVERLRVSGDLPNENIEKRVFQIRKYIECLLRITYSHSFRFSNFVSRSKLRPTKEGKRPKFDSAELRLTIEKSKEPKFNPTVFQIFEQIFANKPQQFELLVDATDTALSPVVRYATLYKIIEFEYHLSDYGRKYTKDILKGSKFTNIIKDFEYDGKKDGDLIDFIVDLRHKCDHFKKDSSGNVFGMLDSNIEDRRVLLKFIPFFTKICGRVIDGNLDIEIS